MPSEYSFFCANAKYHVYIVLQNGEDFKEFKEKFEIISKKSLKSRPRIAKIGENALTFAYEYDKINLLNRGAEEQEYPTQDKLWASCNVRGARKGISAEA